MRRRKINPIVIKYGGSLLNKPSIQKHFFKQLALLARTQGVVIVHGGGREITEYLKKFHVKTRFVKGLRFTDHATMDIVEMVLSAKVNKDIVSKLKKWKISAVGISGRDDHTIVAKPIPGLGRVGNPVTVNTKLIRSMLGGGFIPVVSPVGSDRMGRPLNINADTTACALAAALKADRLIYLTDVPGILDKKGIRIPKISIAEIKKLIKNKTVSDGMIPKLKSAAYALKKGVHEVDIIKGGKTLSFKDGTRILSR